MKTASLILGVLLGALAAAAPAQARKGGEEDFDRRPQFEDRRGGERFQPRGRGDEFESRRLTPEERRDLRRDIRDAGRDIYDERDRRRRGRD